MPSDSCSIRNMTAVYLRKNQQLLMLYRIGSKVVPPSWCGIGGHFEPEEWKDPYACAYRELQEEIGVLRKDISNMQLRYITMRKKGKEIRINYYFFADLVNPDIVLPNCSEGILEWVDYEHILERDMPFSAKSALQHYFSVGKNNNCLYGGIAEHNEISFAPLTDF